MLQLLLLLLLVPCHLSSRGHVVRHRLLALLWREHLQVAGGHHSPARGNKSNCDRATAAAARPADQPPDVQLVDAGDPGHGGHQLGLDSGQQSEGRREELQTKVPEDYAKFYNHGEG